MEDSVTGSTQEPAGPAPPANGWSAWMTVEEVARNPEYSAPSVHGDWRVAKMWLAKELLGEGVK